LNKARKHATINGLSRERVEEREQHKFEGMTEEDIQEERKEYTLSDIVIDDNM
jgi:hypothetical protein